ncbi:MAG: SBBP repeat-containing protein [Saprospiraceae bacterium]|nr:SBBP repeat-containing protein [Saprospiraceae bacterium]
MSYRKECSTFRSTRRLTCLVRGGAATDELYSMTTDPSGNIYVTGSITGPASFGDTTVKGCWRN